MNVFLLIAVICCAGVVWLLGVSGAEAPGERRRANDGREPLSALRYRINDAHLHYVDFLQQPGGIEYLIQKMDGVGVEHAMINGLPVIKKWEAIDPRRPVHYLADDSRTYWYSATDVLVGRTITGLPDHQRRRFHPYICGFNPTDRNAVDHVRRMMDWFPGLWEGIGEVVTRHDDLTALTYGEQARANHVALDPVYALAAANDMPVCIHSDISSAWVREPLYLPEMEEAFQRHPRTRFIWAHAGIGRRIEVPGIVDEVRCLLQTYPNLWFDLSWVVYPMEVAPGGIPDSRWITLVEEFPARFMIGSDRIGHFSDYEETIDSYAPFLAALSEETARQVAGDNFLKVLPARVQKQLAVD